MTKDELYKWIVDQLIPNEAGSLEWTKQKDKDGYGRLKYMKKDIRVHRFMLEMKLNKELGSDIVTRHTCNNPPCCNPEHLLEGSSIDNINDKIKSGRCIGPRGELQWRSKLTKEQVIEIYSLKNIMSKSDLAKRYNVGRLCILKIHNGTNWKHVTSLIDK